MIYLDGKLVAARKGAALLEILRSAGLDPALTVVSVDGEFVPLPDYRKLRPREDARVIVREMQSGG